MPSPVRKVKRMRLSLADPPGKRASSNDTEKSRSVDRSAYEEHAGEPLKDRRISDDDTRAGGGPVHP